jgi:hypothetical protein
MSRGLIARFFDLGDEERPPRYAATPRGQARAPTLDERANLYLRAVHGEREFGNQDYAMARRRILDAMADDIAAVRETRTARKTRPGTFPEPSAREIEIAAQHATMLASEFNGAEFAKRYDVLTDRAELFPLREEAALSPHASIAKTASAGNTPSPARNVAIRRRIQFCAAAVVCCVVPLSLFIILPAADPNSTKSSIAVEQTQFAQSAVTPAPKSSLDLTVSQLPTQQSAAPAVAQEKSEPLVSCKSVTGSACSSDSVLSSTTSSFAAEPAAPTAQLEESKSVVRSVDPSSTKSSVAFRPASPPQQSTAPAVPLAAQRVGLVPIRQLDPGEAAEAVKRAQQLIVAGKILPARLMLKKAVEMGNAAAALALGTTYDPIELESLGVTNSAPNIAMAMAWYQKAKELGATNAADMLERLRGRASTAPKRLDTDSPP